MTMSREAVLFSILPVLMVWSGCSSESSVAEPRTEFKPDVSLNQVMVGMVDHNSHLLWNAATDEYAPVSDADWHELEHAAITLTAAGNVILIGGSGPEDAEWVQKPDWAKLTQAQTDAALGLLMAVEHKNRDELAKAGDALTDSCDACHTAYKPELPAIVATPEEQPEHYYGQPNPTRQ